MAKPKLMMDTNVCGVLRRQEYRGDLERIRSEISLKFKLVISPQTFLELLDTIQGGDGSYFDSDKELFRLMAGNGRPKFLQFPGHFALRKVLGIESAVTKFNPDDFEKWLRLVLHAKSRDELFGGNVRLPRSLRRGRWGFDPSVVRRQQDRGKSEHQTLMERARDGKSTLPSPGQWAGAFALMMGHKIDLTQAAQLARGLDAAYQYYKNLCTTVAGGSYNFAKHQGDWVDSQQLFYLCDPEIFLLTDDSGLVNRVGNSSQRNRILDLREFLGQLGFAPRH